MTNYMLTETVWLYRTHCNEISPISCKFFTKVPQITLNYLHCFLQTPQKVVSCDLLDIDRVHHQEGSWDPEVPSIIKYKVHRYNGRLFILKEEWNVDTCCDVDEPPK